MGIVILCVREQTEGNATINMSANVTISIASLLMEFLDFCHTHSLFFPMICRVDALCEPIEEHIALLAVKND